MARSQAHIIEASTGGASGSTVTSALTVGLAWRDWSSAKALEDSSEGIL
jgi:hypothetical protein